MPLQPDLAEVITAALDARLLDLHTCTIGQVWQYDAATQRAAITPLIRRVEYSDEDGRTSYEMPMLQSVPVIWPRAGGYALHFPLKQGDQVLLVFAEHDVSFWRTNEKTLEPRPGQTTIPHPLFDPGDLTLHGMSDAFAIAGVAPDPNPIEGASADHAVLVVPDGGKLRVSRSAGSGVEPVALAEKVAAQLTALKQAIAGAAVSPMDGGASFKAAILSALADWPGDVASSTLEAEGE